MKHRKPPIVPKPKKPLYGFQGNHIPPKNLVENVEKKNTTFKALLNHYKPLIDAKNRTEPTDNLEKNVFNSDKHKVKIEERNRKGDVKVDYLVKPFELRLFELRK